jgi:hypothetical protein
LPRKGATDPSRFQPLVYSPCTRLPLFLGAAQVYDLGADGEAVRFVTSLDAQKALGRMPSTSRAAAFLCGPTPSNPPNFASLPRRGSAAQ